MISDEELYRQYLSGDETGLEELIRKYDNPLTLYINGYLHDIHEAEDLMIEVFSYLFAKRPPIRDGGFRAYLYKAARHMALRHKSIRRHHFCLDDLTKEPEGGKLVDEVIRTKERNQILHLCMGELHPDYRETTTKKTKAAADRCYFLHSGMPCGDLRGFLCHVRDFRANGAGELLRI